MEYLIGSLVTLLTVFVVTKNFIVKDLSLPKRIVIRHSQSHLYSLVGRALDNMASEPPRPPSQAIKHYDGTHVRIIFTDNKAYWIANSTFYEADMTETGVDHENAKAVDIMGMDKVQLDKMMFIVEKLTEGLSNDSSNSG